VRVVYFPDCHQIYQLYVEITLANLHPLSFVASICSFVGNVNSIEDQIIESSDRIFIDAKFDILAIDFDLLVYQIIPV